MFVSPCPCSPSQGAGNEDMSALESEFFENTKETQQEILQAQEADLLIANGS